MTPRDSSSMTTQQADGSEKEDVCTRECSRVGNSQKKWSSSEATPSESWGDHTRVNYSTLGMQAVNASLPFHPGTGTYPQGVTHSHVHVIGHVSGEALTI